MEEGETVTILSRKEQRKQKLMDYLAAKGKPKLSHPKAYLPDERHVHRPVTSAPKAVKGKENKPPSERIRPKSTEVQPQACESFKKPSRNAFGVTTKVNLKGSLLDRRQNDTCLSANGGQAQPKMKENPMLRSTYTVYTSKSNLSSSTHINRQPNKPSSNAGCKAIIKSNVRLSNNPRALLSGSGQTTSVRMSLGPLVKTKTGLIPAVIQPRNTNCHLSRTAAKAVGSNTNTTCVANKVVSSSLYQRSAVVQRKMPCAIAVGNSKERTATSLSANPGKDQNVKKVVLKHSQPSFQKESSGLISTLMPSKCRGAHIKPEGKLGISKPIQPAGQPTDRRTKLRGENGGEKNGPSCRAAFQTSSMPPRCSSTAVKGKKQAAASELSGPTMTMKDVQIKKGYSSANVQPQKPSVCKTVISKTVPQPARTRSFTGQTRDTKTTKLPLRAIPQTEGRKPSAAQEERMKKLQEWRESKGISYKRPPMPAKPQVRRTAAVPQPFWAAMKDEDEAQSLICAVDRSLADCIKLLEEGCLPDKVKDVVSRLPAVSQKFAKYWICQARLMEQEGNLDVLPMFEEAVRVVLEPVDELRSVVFEILKKKDEIQASVEGEKDELHGPADEGTPESSKDQVETPEPVRALICGERGDASVVKYKVTATPGGPPSQQTEPVRVNGQEVRFFTPVRRSVRIGRASHRYPASLQDHDLCVMSYSDIISKEQKQRSEEEEAKETSQSADDTPMYIYRQNEALKDKVMIQLFSEED